MPPTSYPETKLSLVSRIKEYGDVYTYSFKPETPVLYSAGQYGHLRLSGMPEGVKAVREFSFVSAPFEAEIKFGVDAKSGSPYQKRLLELAEGDTVGLFKIKGHMTWPPMYATRAVFVAGGIGVTPFRSMLADKREKKLALPVTLLHVAHGEYLYGAELKMLANEYVSADRASFPDELKKLAERNLDAHFYIAGSPGFTDAAVNILSALPVKKIDADPFKGLGDEL